MRKYLLAAVAAAAISSPAVARDGSPYIGIEGGLVIDGDLDLDIDGSYDGVSFEYNDAFDIDFKRGLDLDVIAGYDFGMFRLEGELGYKRLRADKVEIDSDVIDEFDLDDEDFDLDVDGSGSVWSLMANGLFDFGDDSGWNGYVGGGIGRARVKFEGERDSVFAWQFIAGARKAISPTVDFGLKYRYFRTGKIDAFSDELDTGDGTVSFAADGKLRTHSLLASLIFNFAAPPPPPPPPPVYVAPPPPPPPATQTCPDGSVILATDMCPPPPEPYVPPPPPPAEPERG